MVEFPPYIKILSGNATRRSGGSSGRSASQARVALLSDAPKSDAGTLGQAEVVSLISRENRAAAVSLVPTPEEASEALRRLQDDLPGLGQAVGELHSNLDRRRILDLLAPLLEV